MRKPVIVVVLTVIIITGGFIFGLRGCLSKYDERAAISGVLYFEKNGKSVVFSLVKFEKATSYSQKGGMTSKIVSTNYYVQSNDGHTGEKLSEKKIRHHSDIKHYPVEIVGSDDNNAWVFIGELMAFDPFTLEVKADHKILTDKNPGLKDRLPEEIRFIKMSPGNGNILITAKDGSKWSLDPSTLKAIPANDELVTEGKDELETAIELNRQMQDTLMDKKLREPSRLMREKKITMSQYQQTIKEFNEERTILYQIRDSLYALRSGADNARRKVEETRRRFETLSHGGSVHFSQVKVNQDTLNGAWYGLYTPSEFSQLYNRVQFQPVYGDASRRQLISSGFNIDRNGETLISKNDSRVSKTSYFLDGGFLLDKTTAFPVHLQDPFSWLVVSKSEIGNEGKILVSRVGLDGKDIWQFNTGLKEWGTWIVAGNRLIVTGHDNKELSGNDQNVLHIIDLGSGKVMTYDYFDDGVRK